MTRNMKASFAALGMVLLAATPAFAVADTTYYLVGTRHVYRIGADPSYHADERTQIEKDFAEWVENDQDTYTKHVNAGADTAQESKQLNDDLEDAAADREKKLSALYENADAVRANRPELVVEGDGPYQVIGIDHGFRGAVAFEDYRVLAPWPGYSVDDVAYGWEYGHVYNRFAFERAYRGWYAHDYVTHGRPAFYGLVGRHGAVHADLARSADGRGFEVTHREPAPRPEPEEKHSGNGGYHGDPKSPGPSGGNGTSPEKPDQGGSGGYRGSADPKGGAGDGKKPEAPADGEKGKAPAAPGGSSDKKPTPKPPAPPKAPKAPTPPPKKKN